jgi:hypothetical protein
MEYEVQWQDGARAFQAPNRTHNLRFSFFSHGFVVQERAPATDAQQWSVVLGLDPLAMGAEAHRGLVAAPLQVDRKRAASSTPAIEVEYLNSTEGMRQNFLVHDAFILSQGLVIATDVEGVRMIVDRDGTKVSFFDGDRELLRYGDLNVWDANGTLLDALFVDLGDDRFSIVVDDVEAVYPILIDPLATSPYFGVNGPQGGAQFGFSVAMAMTKQTTMADLIVGAPFYDNGQADEGRVFVY